MQIIIAFTFLIVCGLVGIIVYATLNPNQKIFNVPDALKPAIPGVTVSSSFTPSPTPSPRSRVLRGADAELAASTAGGRGAASANSASGEDVARGAAGAAAAADGGSRGGQPAVAARGGRQGGARPLPGGDHPARGGLLRGAPPGAPGAELGRG